MSAPTTILPGIRHDEEIDSFRVRLYFLSRDPGLLSAVALCVLAISVALAWYCRAPEAWDRTPVAAETVLRGKLSGAAPDAAGVLGLLPAVALSEEKVRAEITGLIGQARFPADGLAVVQAVWGSLLTFTNEPNADLLILAYRPEPPAGANEAIGDLHAGQGRTASAVSSYRREIDLAGTPSARRKLVDLLVRGRQLSLLREIESVPEFATYFTPRLRLSLALGARDWAGVASALSEVERQALKALPVALVCVAGLVWFLLALQAIQPASVFSVRTCLPLLALLLGLASTWPSHFISAWQEEVWGLRASGAFLNDFLYYVGGVAPREELIKLLCLAPFLPILKRRGSRLEVLVIAGCIGLGFAMEGNLQAYAHAGPDGAFGRFLTANFFHFAATGLTGLALCDFLREPRRQLLPLLATLTAVIIAHGIYDAFIAVRGVRLLSLVSMLSFLVLSLAFFHELRLLRDETTDQLSLSATLLLGLTVLTGATLVCASMQLGFPLASAALATNAAGLAVVVLIFYKQLGRRVGPAQLEPQVSV